jgi:2-methylcitrate dehydratase PrpD
MAGPRTSAVEAATVSERLADHVVGLRLDDVPDAVVRKTKDHLVHHFGLAFRDCASGTEKPSIDLALELSGADGCCTIVGQPRKADLLEAVFANAMLMCHAGMDDFQLPPGTHPGTVIQPTAWAVGEANRASGRELLAAVIVGYDVMSKLCRPVWTWDTEVARRPNSVVGPLGVAATAARLLGLNHEQTVHALGHAGQAASGIAEGVEHLGTMHPLLARNGVMAAMLAKAGMPASSTIVDGRHGLYRSFFFQDVPDQLRDDLATLGADFEISKAEVKRMSASALNFVPIELAQQLVAEHALDASRVAEVVIALPRERRNREAAWETGLSGAGPAAEIGRRGALRFRVAMIIADGRTDPSRYVRDPDADLAGLLDKMRILWEADRPLRYARIEVTTTDGQSHSMDGDRYVAPRVDWTEWLTEGGRAVVGEHRISRLVELIENLEDVTDVADVMAVVAGSHDPEMPPDRPVRQG